MGQLIELKTAYNLLDMWGCWICKQRKQ
jgi:hypothetical protein